MSEIMNLNWSGTLTFNNVSAIAMLMNELLAGKRFTTVSANELDGFRPKVRLGNKLRVGGELCAIRFVRSVARWPEQVTVILNDQEFTWTFFTKALQDRSPDPAVSAPHLTFDGDRVTITHRAESGCKVHWVFVVEKE